MPLYSISTGVPTQTTTNTALTLGYGPNMIAPPDLLFWACTAGGTVTLPSIESVLPVPPGTPGTSPGIGDGYTIKIKNTTGNALTITPVGSDTIDSYTLGGLNDIVTFQASLYNTNWNNLSASGALYPIKYQTNANYTVATTDRYLIESTAGTVTIPAPTNFTAYVPFVTIISSNVLITVTPASGNINGQASRTIAAAGEASLMTDGTNFFATAG